MYDEIIAKKHSTFTKTYEIVHTLEATHDTANEVKKIAASREIDRFYSQIKLSFL